MCGILAYYDVNGYNLPKKLLDGLNSMVHRGPDSVGSFTDHNIFLGHRRLKIIDLSDQANQPMSCEEGRYWIIFNGEIYNYRELRKSLQKQGHKFQTESDTEVLLHAFQEYNENCLEYLNGMFAFIIYDTLEKKIFAARDRLGIKPLYYYFDKKKFALASEIRALVESNIIKPEINETALYQFLLLGSVQSPSTILNSVYALMPGHYAIFKNGKLKVCKYWSPPFIPETEKKQVTKNEAVYRIRELLEDSIRLRLVSDVPLGVFLSGGVDSSTIVALMSNLGVSKIKTFSLGFDVGGKDFNETNFAKVIAEKFNTDHNEFILNGDNIVNDLFRFIRYIDQPSCDGLNTYFVSKFASKHVTVCLSGLGGDELFAGYTWVKFLHFLSRVKKVIPYLPTWLCQASLKGYEALPSNWKRSKAIRTLFGSMGAWPEPLLLYNQFHKQFENSDLANLSGNFNLSNIYKHYEHLNNKKNLAAVDTGCLIDQSIYLRNTLLRDVDAVSMAHSIEARVPFLDHRLVEFVAQLPAELKINLGKSKFLLLESIKDLLPSEFFNRKKMGFSFPIKIWLQSSNLREVLLDCFSNNGLKKRNIFKNEYLEKLLYEGLNEGQRNQSSLSTIKLWSLLILELWMRENIDKH